MIKGFLYTTLGIDLRGKEPVMDSYWSRTSMDYSNPLYGESYAASNEQLNIPSLPEIIQVQKERADMRLVYVKEAPITTNKRIA